MPTHSSARSLFRSFMFVAAGMLLGVAIMAAIRTVSAFTEPASAPPTGNMPAPVNVSSVRQNKNGELGILNLFLGIGGSEGSIFNTDIIQGFNDLRLFGNSAKNVPVYLEGNPVVINNDAGTGNVGIGTASPVDRVHIAGTAIGPFGIRIDGAYTNDWATGRHPQLAFADSGTIKSYIAGAGVSGAYSTGATPGDVVIVVYGNDLLYASDAGPAKVTFKSSGNVGIGTESPGQRLDVAGGYVRSDTGFCIGGDCRTSWPPGAGMNVYACPNYTTDPRGDCGLNDQTCIGQISTESTCFWYPGPDCDVAVKVTESCTLAGRLIAP